MTIISQKHDLSHFQTPGSTAYHDFRVCCGLVTIDIKSRIQAFRIGIFKKNQTFMYIVKWGLLMITGFFFSLALPAQKSLTGLIGAEKAFAAYTESHSIREGFLAFMDSSGLVFKNGKAVNAIEYYQNQPISKAILSWKPDFAVISNSGNLGVTAGPYELRAEKMSDKPIAKGNFSSVWKMNSKGAWKNIIDLGTGYGENLVPVEGLFQLKLTEKNQLDAAFARVRTADSLLNIALLNHKDEIQKFLTNETRFQQNGQLPVTGKDQVMQSLLAVPAGITFTYAGGGIADSRNLVYIYGITHRENRTDNYVRVWVFRENEWKVILQTIRW
jgi:hypothetical protein